MSNNIEYRSFWEYGGTPINTVTQTPASHGRIAIGIKRAPTPEEIKRAEFTNRFKELTYTLSHFDFKYNTKERLKY